MTGRYENLKQHRGIVRVHSRTCGWAERRCSCTPGYRAEAYDRITQRRQVKTWPTLKAALRWREDTRTALRAGTTRITEAMTLQAAWDLFYDGVLKGTVKASGGGDYKPAVVRAYETKWRLYLLPRFGRVAVGELRLVHVQEMIDELVASGAAPKTVRNTVIPLRALYRWAIRRELCTVNPCDNVELPSGEVARDRIADVPEALRLLAAVPERDRAIWACAFFAGLRRGELLALDWSSVDLFGRKLRVSRSYDPGSQQYVAPKTKKGTREVGIPQLLVVHLAALNRTEGLVFGPTGLVPFNPAKLHERAYKTWDDAKLRRITLHECRHTYASLMIEAGVNIKKISEYMGHASINITLDRYGHLLPGDLTTTLAQFDTYLAASV
ncbi:MAG: tyrosine-type recombinase/integrase [Mycobacteriaceae bacterium]